MTQRFLTNLGSRKREHRLDLAQVAEVAFVVSNIRWAFILRNRHDFITLALDLFQRCQRWFYIFLQGESGNSLLRLPNSS